MRQQTRGALSVLQILNVVVFVAVIVTNALANLLPIGGRTTQDVAAMYPNMFQPAGFTFSIWGLVYFMLALFVLYQAEWLPAVRGGAGRVDDIGLLFILSSLANIAWLFAWHNDLILLTVPIMLVLLISLILIYRRLRGREPIGAGETLFARIPFSLYLGWISVATIANITIALVSVNFGGFGLPEQFWTVVVILVALALALLFLWLKDDTAFALVIAWAFTGILVRHLTELDGQFTAVIAATIAGLVIIFGALAFRGLRRLRE